jgi:transcriptional regulator with XRE-family HTH domain
MTRNANSTAAAFDFKAFDERLVSLRILTDELAEAIGVEAATVDRWREGRGVPSADSLIRLRPILASDEAAIAAVERVRRTFHRNYAEGDRAALNITTTTVGPPVRDGAHYGSAV